MKGKILGSRYQVLKYIAQGGFGRTYLAQDTQLPGKDLCVVKQLSPNFNDPNLLKIARRLFKTEATALHNLGHHPQIPLLLAYFEEADKFYLVQQYIQGQTIEKELATDRIWSAEKTIKLLKDCLNILQFIHEQGVIHRDLKPANLIRHQVDNKIVVVDFGTVKNVFQGHSGLAQLTVAVGTQGYMPIEQARGKPSSRSDLYALGVICIQALTGIAPLNLEEDENGEIVWSHLTTIEPELKNILTKMTRYNAIDRYQSAKSILDELENCADLITTPLPDSAIATTSVKQTLVATNTAPAKQLLTKEFQTTDDPNALPGIRSVALVERAPKKVKTEFLKQRWWQITLGIIILAGGIYLSLQGFISHSDSPSETKTNLLPE